MNQVINQVLANTVLLQNGGGAGFYNTANKSRPFNDLPPEEPPKEDYPDICGWFGGCSGEIFSGPLKLNNHILAKFFVWLGSHQDVPDFSRHFTPAERVEWLTANHAKILKHFTPQQMQDWFINYAEIAASRGRGEGRHGGRHRGGKRGGGGVTQNVPASAVVSSSGSSVTFGN